MARSVKNKLKHSLPLTSYADSTALNKILVKTPNNYSVVKTLIIIHPKVENYMCSTILSGQFL